MMQKESFDDFIGRAAREIDPAPAVPRDEMWQAISAARQADRSESDNGITGDGGPATPPDTRVIPIGAAHAQTQAQIQAQTPRNTHAWLKWGAPLAAMLVVGVGLGRLTMGGQRTATTGPASNVASNAMVDTPPATTDSAQTDSAGTLTPKDESALATLGREPATAVTPSTGAKLARAEKRHPASGTIVRGNSAATTTNNRNATAAVAFRMAAIRHFERVQTLLVAVPADARDGHINDIAVRAADLLVNTRLLLDSPAANDRDVHRLLDDLELILAQVATISPTRSAEDVDMIQDAITKRDVLLRLHAVTAGSHLSGT
jgi:hypothetical protein